MAANSRDGLKVLVSVPGGMSSRARRSRWWWASAGPVGSWCCQRWAQMKKPVSTAS
ncbi:hypothetical protein ACFP3R_32150 [Saccharothrix lopnurensis]|uniref:Uncharacterized protein n=1 Tax=Saccharothrix lopnurensis TaxID=1670621 RepID=A0ABW1PEA6_9PSEU